MTVIAATHKSMSADTFSHTKVSGFYVHKIVRVGKSLVGCAGPSELCQRFINWRTKGSKRPVWGQNDQFEALVLDKTGLYVYYTSCTPDRVNLPYFAIGSGRQYAMGALAQQATSEQAVDTACLFDPYSKAPVETLTL